MLELSSSSVCLPIGPLVYVVVTAASSASCTFQMNESKKIIIFQIDPCSMIMVNLRAKFEPFPYSAYE